MEKKFKNEKRLTCELLEHLEFFPFFFFFGNREHLENPEGPEVLQEFPGISCGQTLARQPWAETGIAWIPGIFEINLGYRWNSWDI